MNILRKLRIWHWGAFAGVVVGMALLFTLRVGADSERYLIDFGETTVTNQISWNNVTSVQARNTTATFMLKDSTGQPGAMSLKFTDPFNCASNGAAVNGNGATNSSLYPASATGDSVYLGLAGTGVCTQTDTTAKLRLGDLSPGAAYEVRFYASRLGNSTDRTTTYTIGSKTVQLNATNNIDDYATITANTSSAGAMDVTIAKAANAAFGYLGVMEIIKSSPPQVSAGADQSVTLPDYQLTLNGNASDSEGIASYKWTDISNSGATFVSPNNASTGVTDLAAGTHTFRLTAIDNGGSSGSDDVTITVRPQDVADCSPNKLAVLGSSTAAGTGASPVSNSWVNRYESYIKDLNSNNSVINLAKSGYSTYQILPADSPRPEGRPVSDTTRNITTAIVEDPDAIIVNMASNDVAAGFGMEEIKANYEALYDAANEAGIPLWFTTTQPRNLDQAGRDKLLALKNWIEATYEERSLDFWSVIANTDSTLNVAYGSGDGIHLNNAGHQKLYNRVADSTILGDICKEAPVISDITSRTVVSQTIKWRTDKPASSRIEYGTSTSYGQMTPESNTNPRVTAHEVIIPDLALCTTYHYRIRSIDGSGIDQLSSNATFTTPCSN